MNAAGLPFELPILSPFEASATSAILTLAYVGSLYLSKTSRVSTSSSSSSSTSTRSASPPTVVGGDNSMPPAEPVALGRDDPSVIKARLKAVSGATLACVFGILGLIQYGSDMAKGLETSTPTLATVSHTFRLLGFPRSLFNFHIIEPVGRILAEPLEYQWELLFSAERPLAPYLLAPLLFLGPIYHDVFLDKLTKKDVWHGLARLTGVRNYLVAPLTEEIVFRSCMIAVAQLSGASHKHLIFVTPLWFGLAHLHHAYDVFLANGRDSRALTVATVSCLFQFAYTTLFGWFAAYLFLRTGSLLPPLVSHIFCNAMGLPQPLSAIDRHPSKALDILAVYVLGIIGFTLAMVKGW